MDPGKRMQKKKKGCGKTKLYGCGDRGQCSRRGNCPDRRKHKERESPPAAPTTSLLLTGWILTGKYVEVGVRLGGEVGGRLKGEVGVGVGGEVGVGV